MNKIAKKILEMKDDNCTFLDAITAVCEKEDISIEDMSFIIKKDNTLLKIIERECTDRNLIKSPIKIQSIDMKLFD